MLEEQNMHYKRNYDEGYECGGRLGAIEGYFRCYIKLRKELNKILQMIDGTLIPEKREELMKRLYVLEESKKIIYPYSNDMDYFINKYPYLDAKKLAEKVLAESEYINF